MTCSTLVPGTAWNNYLQEKQEYDGKASERFDLQALLPMSARLPQPTRTASYTFGVRGLILSHLLVAVLMQTSLQLNSRDSFSCADNHAWAIVSSELLSQPDHRAQLSALGGGHVGRLWYSEHVPMPTQARLKSTETKRTFGRSKCSCPVGREQRLNDLPGPVRHAVNLPYILHPLQHNLDCAIDLVPADDTALVHNAA